MRKRTLISILLVMIMVTAIPLTSMAASRYCGPCNRTSNWVKCCAGVRSKASIYGTCGTDCNYYSVWYRNGEKCPTCNNKVQVTGDHWEANIHDIPSHDSRHCPY